MSAEYTKYKRYAKLSDGTYKLISHWTSSNTVEFDDGNTAQTKLGAISGITDSLTADSPNVALSAAGGKNLQTQISELNSNLASDFTGNIYKLIHVRWTGTVIGGQIVNFGSFHEHIPAGYNFIGMLLTPQCTVHITMSYYDYHVYAYSENFTGEIYYDALLVLRKI